VTDLNIESFKSVSETAKDRMQRDRNKNELLSCFGFRHVEPVEDNFEVMRKRMADQKNNIELMNLIRGGQKSHDAYEFADKPSKHTETASEKWDLGK
jgi:hypothetical protein